MTKPRQLVQRNLARLLAQSHPPVECWHQLTLWVHARAEVEFAIDLQMQAHAPWMLRESFDGLVAVFVR